MAITVLVVIAVTVGWQLRDTETKTDTAATTVRPATQVAADTLRQAAVAMGAAASYRFVGTVEVGGHAISIAGEFAAPDRLHESVSLDGEAPVERIAIGAIAYQRNGTTWQRVAGAATSGDPRGTFAALARATAVTPKGPGVSFELSGNAAGGLVTSGSASTSVTGAVTITNGNITDITYHSTVAAGTTVHFAYSEIGTAPPVTVPQLTP